jgi:transcriptional regulator of acetoin/glycerol metabolism
MSMTLDQIEKEAVLRELEFCDWEVRSAMLNLRIPKTTFYRKLQRWQIVPPPVREAPICPSCGNATRRSSRRERNSSRKTPRPGSKSLKQIRRQAILDELNRCGGHRVKAARRLGIGIATIYRIAPSGIEFRRLI